MFLVVTTAGNVGEKASKRSGKCPESDRGNETRTPAGQGEPGALRRSVVGHATTVGNTLTRTDACMERFRVPDHIVNGITPLKNR